MLTFTAKLVVVDIAPDSYHDKHSDVFAALFAANVSSATSREAVQEVLRSKLEDETTVQFLLKSLTRSERANVNFEWRFNLDALFKNYSSISGEVKASTAFTGHSMFIKGGNSNYINSSNYSSIVSLFPNHSLEEIKDAGHWVHAEKPAEFTELVVKFLTSQSQQ
jgi:esterase